MATNGGAETETLSAVEVTGNRRTRKVFATFRSAADETVKTHVRTLMIIGDPAAPPGPPDKSYTIQYIQDVDNIPAIREYIVRDLMPRMVLGHVDAVHDASLLISGSVMYLKGSSSVTRGLQVIGLEAAGQTPTPFKTGFGIDLTAFGAASLSKFKERMAASTAP